MTRAEIGNLDSESADSRLVDMPHGVRVAVVSRSLCQEDLFHHIRSNGSAFLCHNRPVLSMGSLASGRNRLRCTFGSARHFQHLTYKTPSVPNPRLSPSSLPISLNNFLIQAPARETLKGPEQTWTLNLKFW